jgi:membrane fusion protein (multidrug efflux system)
LFRFAVKAVIVLIAIGLLAGVIMMPADKEEPAATEAPPVNVTVETVAAEAQLVDAFDLPAVVEPNRVVTISAEVAGRIERILSTEGRPVAAGSLLIELNADLIRPQVERAKAQYDRDEIEYKRMAELVDMDATSRSDLDNATVSLAASKAQLAEVQARLERTRILAPMAGVLNDLPVEEGEYVQPGMPAAELVETDPVKVVVDVPERDVAFFEVGRPAEVFADVRGDEISRTGTITFINELADPQTRSTKMEVSVANEEGLLRSGQIVRVRLTRRILDNAVLIPLLAVIPMEQGHAVFVVNSSEAQRREVTLDIIQGDRILVTQGLEPGEKLIVAGHRFIAPGQNVTITSEKK